MDPSIIWKTILIVIIGVTLLRIAGRKSVSELTIAQTVIMISIGTLLIQPVVGKNVWVTLLVATIMIGILILMEYLELKLDFLESIITGKSIVLIENGKLKDNNLSKLRMSVDQLEIKLRQKSIMKLSDVEWATLEANGQLGFILKEKAQPMTKEDFHFLMEQLNLQITYESQLNSSESKENIFKEVSEKKHKNPPPKELQ